MDEADKIFGQDVEKLANLIIHDLFSVVEKDDGAGWPKMIIAAVWVIALLGVMEPAGKYPLSSLQDMLTACHEELMENQRGDFI